MLENVSAVGRITDVTLNMLSSAEILLRKLLVSFNLINYGFSSIIK